MFHGEPSTLSSIFSHPLLFWRNMPFLSSQNPHFQTEVKCKTFLVILSFICIRKKKKVSLIASLWNRGFGQLGYGLLISPFLFRVAHCTECRMSSSNLAKVFGPTLVGNSSTDIEPMQMLQEAKWQPKVMWEFLSLACVAGACTKWAQGALEKSLLRAPIPLTCYFPTPATNAIFP